MRGNAPEILSPLAALDDVAAIVGSLSDESAFALFCSTGTWCDADLHERLADESDVNLLAHAG